MAIWNRPLPRPLRLLLRVLPRVLLRVPGLDRTSGTGIAGGTGIAAVVLTALGLIAPDALGGLGPLTRPVLDADLLDDSPWLQLLAVLALVAPALGAAALPGRGRVPGSELGGRGGGQRRGVVAAALATVSAQPLLAGLNEPLGADGVPGGVPGAAGIGPASGWVTALLLVVLLSVLALAMVAAVTAVELVGVHAARAVALLLSMLSGPAPSPAREQVRCPVEIGPPSTVERWARRITRRGPPRPAPAAS